LVDAVTSLSTVGEVESYGSGRSVTDLVAASIDGCSFVSKDDDSGLGIRLTSQRPSGPILIKTIVDLGYVVSDNCLQGSVGFVKPSECEVRYRTLNARDTGTSSLRNGHQVRQ
jgi:hypothetical protein